MTQSIGNIPAQTPFDDPDLKIPSPIWIRWFQRLINLPEPPTLYTPVITSGSGAFTTVSAKGRYRKLGKLVFVQITITITTNGTAAGSVIATLPFSALTTTGVQHILAGRGRVLSGKMLQGVIDYTAPTQAIIFNYDNSYPASSGETLVLSGFYEVA